MNFPTLVTTNYTPPGSFIGQLIIPQPGQASAEARLPCYVAKGSRLAVGGNLPIRRSYVFAETLSFTSVAPYLATLKFTADGNQTTAVLHKSDGTTVRNDRWSFYNNNTQILIAQDIYDASKTYTLDYQSISRNVKDIVPVAQLREIISVGTSVDNPQYQEYQNFWIEYSITDGTPQAANTFLTSTLDAPAAAVGNTGTGTIAQNAGSAYTDTYTRLYTLTCTAAAGTTPNRTATIKWTATPVSPGNNNDYPVPLNAADTSPTISLTENTPSTLTNVALEKGITLDFTFGATNFVNTDSFTFNANGPGKLEHDSRLDNTNQYALINTPVRTNGLFGTVSLDLTASYTGLFNANYKIKCSAASGTSPSRSATFVWAEQGERIGVNGTFTALEATPASLVQTLSAGVVIDVAFTSTGTNNFNVGDYFTIACKAPRKFLEAKDSRNYTLTVTQLVQTSGILTISGATYAAPIEITTTAHGLSNGDTVVITGVGGNTAANGTWVIVVTSATKFTLTGSTANAAYTSGGQAVRPAKFTGTYSTDTIEGSFGAWTASADGFASSVTGHNTGYFTLPNNVSMVVRNAFKGPTTVAAGSRVVANDIFKFATSDLLTINWALTARLSEVFQTTDFLTDQNGTITGSSGTKYVLLKNTPTNIISVLQNVTPVSYSNPVGTGVIAFTGGTPAGSVTITYDWLSAEPDPGQTYFFTAKYLRPPELYNTPILILSRDDGRTLLNPMMPTNDAAIMNELAFDNGVPGYYIIQVLDSDGDGVFSNANYLAAILASEGPSRITDLTVLSHYTSWGDMLASLNKMNDPFARRERLGYFGMPVGTAIGDANTVDTLVYAATKTLQVFGNSPAHGTRILVAPTQATKDVLLVDGTTATVTLDGSFVAGALSALIASFTDPGTDILRNTLAGFKTMQTYGDVEAANNRILGGANIIYFTDQGASVFRIEEDVTVDNFASDFKLINNMTQKQFAVKQVRSAVDSNLIGIVVPSAEAGVGLIKGFLVGELETLVSRGLVGAYQDASGNERPIDPDADVVVFRDTTDPTLYNILFCFFTRNPIKRIFGLYAVNTNDFGLGTT